MKRFSLFFLAALPALLAAEQAGAEAPHDMTPWLWANFLILMGALAWLGVKHGGPFLQARQETIAKGISDAVATKADADQRVAKVDARLANLDAEIATLKTQMIEEQQQESKRLADRNTAEIARIQQQMQQEIESAGKSARIELQAHAAKLAVDLAERKLRDRMNDETRHSLARNFVESLQ